MGHENNVLYSKLVNNPFKRTRHMVFAGEKAFFSICQPLGDRVGEVVKSKTYQKKHRHKILMNQSVMLQMMTLKRGQF